MNYISSWSQNFDGDPQHDPPGRVTIALFLALFPGIPQLWDQYVAEAGEEPVNKATLLLSCYVVKRLYCCAPFALQAFFEGKLKVTGNTALALKLQTIIPRPGKAKL